MGYSRAGFTEIVGVDIKPQPRYPFTFVLADALESLAMLAEGGCIVDRDGGCWYLEDFAAVHASPPCQGYSKLAAMHPDMEWVRLIEPTRDALMATGLPWVMENVETAPMLDAPSLFGLYGVTLCGSTFGLGVGRGYLRRHRLFESSFPIPQPACRHKGPAVGVYGHGGHSGKHRMLYRQEASEAMGIDWMNRDEMCEAIPPAYTEYIGRQLLKHARLAL